MKEKSRETPAQWYCFLFPRFSWLSCYRRCRFWNAGVSVCLIVSLMFASEIGLGLVFQSPGYATTTMVLS